MVREKEVSVTEAAQGNAHTSLRRINFDALFPLLKRTPSPKKMISERQRLTTKKIYISSISFRKVRLGGALLDALVRDRLVNGHDKPDGYYSTCDVHCIRVANHAC